MRQVCFWVYNLCLCPESLISLAFFLRIGALLKSTVILLPLPIVWLFYYKKILKLNEQYQYLYQWSNWNTIKHGCSKRGYNNTISECCKIWKDEDLSYLHGKCYPTILSLPLHREPYIPVFHFISYLTDYQIQILKKWKCERSPHISFPRCSILFTWFAFLHFSFLIIKSNQTIHQIVLISLWL